MTKCAEDRAALLVFARAPVPGEAKTRLIPLLGAVGAARLQQRLTEHALATAIAADVGRVGLWCTPDRDHPFFLECARRYPIDIATQCGSTLGERLAFAAVRELHSHGAILIVGTDCPALTCAHLRAARAALRHNDVVIQPAEDGGYVLIGLSRPCAEAFTEIDWGSSRVFEQTMSRLSMAGRRVRVHERLWDVDVPPDYERLARLAKEWTDWPIQRD